MKKVIRINTYILIYLLFTCLLSCTNSSTREEWFFFAKDILKYGKGDNKMALVKELSLSDVSLGREVMKKLVKANPNLEYRPPTQPPNQEKIYKDYQEEVEIFIRSYKDLFEGQLACVTSPLKDLKGIDSHSVIIWVKMNDKLFGIKIDEVFRTSKGFKVNSWVGSHGYPPNPSSKLNIKRALIEGNECEHPETVRYKYQYIN